MRKGFSLVEILVALSIFGIFVVLFFNFFEINRNSYENVNNKNKAILLAKEGIEVVRNIRDNDFSLITNGVYGLASSTGIWSFQGSSDQIDDFTREIIISDSDDPDIKKIESKIIYDVFGNSNTFSLTAYLGNWQKELPNNTCINQADFLSIDVSGYLLANNGKNIENVLISNTAQNCEIVLSSVLYTITPDKPPRRLKEILIDSISVWSGNISPGETADILDTTISPAVTFPLDLIFNASISGKTFDITFIMSDGTSQILNGFAP